MGKSVHGTPYPGGQSTHVVPGIEGSASVRFPQTETTYPPVATDWFVARSRILARIPCTSLTTARAVTGYTGPVCDSLWLIGARTVLLKFPQLVHYVPVRLTSHILT